MRTNSIGQYIISVILCLWLIAMATSVAVAQDPMVPDPTNWGYFTQGAKIVTQGQGVNPYQASLYFGDLSQASGWSLRGGSGWNIGYCADPPSWMPGAVSALNALATRIPLWGGMFVNSGLYYNWNYQRSWQYQAAPRLN